MAKHTEQLMVYDERLGTSRGVTLELTGPELVLQALDRGCLNTEILANAIYGSPGNRCVVEARVIVKDRMGKVRR